MDKKSAPNLPTHADQTMLKSFFGCRRKFYWWYLRRVDFKITPPYFIWGQAWQEMLCFWYSKTELDLEERLSGAISLGEKLWNDSGTLPMGYNNLDTLRWAMIFYAANFPEEPWEIITLDEKVELGFEIPFPPRPIWSICGAIDGYIDWGPFGLLVLENKSAGIDVQSAKYLLQWSFDLQPMTYTWALRQILEQDPFGTYMNCVCKKITQKNIKEFQEAHIIPHAMFARKDIQKSSFHYREFEQSVNDCLIQIEVEWDLWHWPKTYNTIECTGGIGKSACPYQRLCLQERNPWEITDEEVEMIPGLVVKRDKWEPWKRGGKS